MSVSANFNIFCDQLKVSEKKKSIISLRFDSISKKLNRDFWNMNTSFGSVFTGCYGRGTANDTIKDIDIIFEMPSQLMDTYKKYGDACQVRFLEDIRRSIAEVYPKTFVDKQHQKISVQFSDDMRFNVLPAFIDEPGSYLFVDSKNPEQWNVKRPLHIIETIKQTDESTNYNLKKLCRMVKAWKQHCNVRIEDVLIDTLVYEFLLSSKKTYESYAHFDVMCLDFFEFLMSQESSKTVWYEISSGEEIFNPFNFRYKAIVAHLKVKKAIQFEASDKKQTARQQWREIFGYKFPESIKEESQINRLFEKSVALYNSQKKCIKILRVQSTTYFSIQFITALLIVLAIIIIGFTDKFSLGASLFAFSSLLFFGTVKFKKYNLRGISFKHEESAADIILIKQEFQTLLRDLKYNNVDVSIIRKRKGELQRKLVNVYKGTTKSIGKKYSEAKEAIENISRIKERVTMLSSEEIQVPVWENDTLFTENSEYTMNLRDCMN